MSFNRLSLLKWLALPVATLIMTGCGSDAYVRDGGSSGSSGSSGTSGTSGTSGGSGAITITGIKPNPKYILSVCDDRVNPPITRLGVVDNVNNVVYAKVYYNVPSGSADYHTSGSGTLPDGQTVKFVADGTGLTGVGYMLGKVVVGDGSASASYTADCSKLDGNYYGIPLAEMPVVGTDDFQLRASAYVISDDGGEIYPPAVGPDGSFWLKHNLQADYVTVGNPYFNPDAVAGVDDIHAYGNLWQWGRKSDGHQLINHLDVYNATAVHPETTSSKSDIPASSVFIASDNDWRVHSNDLLWSPEELYGDNQICPNDWRLATDAEWFAINGGNDGNGINGSFQPPEFLHLSRAGQRVGSNGVVTGQGGVTDYWTSTVRNGHANALRFWGYGKNDSTFQSSAKANARPIRCRYGK
ncbi:hypothetical protein MNB_SV-6-79 [hydrothermal vent metagenome]|uniref:Fibrobacter succinogenes major paralogous domain-containing protein n=1 Tax=hydrothermal vent metagenome TaxID=652676 RepID=A0A1W1BK53_9ZZZZ